MENNKRNFVYLVVSQDKQANCINSGQASEAKKYGGFHIYGIYKDIHAAIDTVHGIYEEQILGVKYDTEYLVKKMEVYN